MRGCDQGLRWTAVLIGLLILLTAAAGTTFAGKKRSSDEGWLGVYIQDVDKDLQEDWDLPSDDGVMIEGIIDDSPAEDAGLEEGDVLMKYDGNAVTSSSRLRRMIRKTKPDTEVKMEILRDGQTQELTVTIGEREEDYSWSYTDDDNYNIRIPRIDIPRIRIPDIPRIDTRTHVYHRSRPRGWIGVELRDLNDQLGEYFGVEKGRGALIESVVEDSPAEKAGIAAGDVIIDINGEKIYDVEDAIDEISDLDEGDEAKITVLRKGSEQTFAVVVEENDDWFDGRFTVAPYSLPAVPAIQVHPARHNHGFSWFDEDDREELRNELQDAMEELRAELKEAKRELKDALEEF